MGTRIRTYSELRRLTTLEERYHYLSLHSVVGKSTFGFERWMNQQFYTSTEWRTLRRKIIIRDNGCDLGIEGYEISGKMYVHHMNPMEAAHISQDDPDILNPEYFITCSFRTHQAIHFGDERQLARPFVPREPGDTKLW